MALLELDVSKDLLITRQKKFDAHASDISTLFYKIKNEAIKIYGEL